MALKARFAARLEAARGRRPQIDHAVRMVEHYTEVKGNSWAGAVTYFGFLSVFPILALAFAVIGRIATYFPNAEEDLYAVIDEVLPGMVGSDPGQISISAIQSAANAALGLGLLGLLYAGLGWLSAMRNALLNMFEKPRKEQPSFVFGKLRDLVVMVTIGVVLIVSVGLSGVVVSYSSQILEALGIGAGLSWLLNLLSVSVGLLANVLLLYVFFRLLADPKLPSRAMWSGAVLGALGFELLTLASKYLLELTTKTPAFQVFGVALILLIWINYFSRITLFAAAWSYMASSSRSARAQAVRESPTAEPATVVEQAVTVRRGSRLRPFLAGALSGWLVRSLTRRR